MIWLELGASVVTGGTVAGAVSWVVKTAAEHKFEQLAHEHRVRFSKLHERRFEVVAEVYASLVRAEQALKRAAAIDTPSVAELRVDYMAFADRANEFFMCFAERRIFFPEDVGAKFDGYWQKMKVAGYVVGSRLEPKQNWLERYGKVVGEDLPTLKAAIEAECRRLLGALEEAAPGFRGSP